LWDIPGVILDLLLWRNAIYTGTNLWCALVLVILRLKIPVLGAGVNVMYELLAE
jgi:hypothetical protein